MEQISLSKNETIAFCPLCGSKNLLCLQEAEDRLIFVTEGDEMKVRIGVRGCESCGFIFLSPRMAPATLCNYYERQSRLPRPKMSADSPFMKLIDIQINLIEQYHPLCDTESVLEIGCAEGFFLNRIIERKNGNIKVFGVEPSKRYLETARHLLPKGYFYGHMLDMVDFGKERFDLVVLRHVLEHVPLPIRNLDIISELLTPSGALYVEVPDTEKATPSVSHFFHHEHLSYFTVETLSTAFARAGFKELHIEQFQSNPVNSGFDYPVLRAIAAPSLKTSVIKNADQPKAIWERHRRAKDVFLKQRLLPVIKRAEVLHSMGRRLGIFGAGPHTMDLLGQMSLPVKAWRVILDNNPAKQGKWLRGIPVELPTSEQFKALDAILVSSAAFEGEIVDQIRAIASEDLETLTIYS